MGSGSHGVIRGDLPEEVESELIKPSNLNLQMRNPGLKVKLWEAYTYHKSLGKMSWEEQLKGKALGGQAEKATEKAWGPEGLQSQLTTFSLEDILRVTWRSQQRRKCLGSGLKRRGFRSWPWTKLLWGLSQPLHLPQAASVNREQDVSQGHWQGLYGIMRLKNWALKKCQLGAAGLLSG